MNKAIVFGFTALLLLAFAVSASPKPAGMTAEQFFMYKGYYTDRPELYCPLRSPTDYRIGSVGTWGALSDGTWICGNWGDNPAKTTVPKEPVVEPEPEPEPECYEECPPCHMQHKCIIRYAGFCFVWKWVEVCPDCYEVCVA